MLFSHDYSERLVTSFVHQIQSEYYGVNQYVYIEGNSFNHKNSVMTHQHHIYENASDMAIATMCSYPPSQR